MLNLTLTRLTTAPRLLPAAGLSGRSGVQPGQRGLILIRHAGALPGAAVG